MTRRDRNSEYVHLWRPPGVEGIELFSARLLSFSYGKHFHEDYTIGINDAGAGSFWCRGANHATRPKSLNLVTPGEVHTGAAISGEGWTYRSLYVAPAKLAEIARQLDWRPGSLPCFRQSVVIDDQIWLGLDQVFRILISPRCRLETETMLLSSLCLLFERFAEPRQSTRRIGEGGSAIAKARDYLEDRYSDDISLDDLAATCGLNSYYLIRCFRKEFGLPPHAYQLQVRLQRAKADLRSDVKLSGIAAKHGFFDQSHFHRHFKKAFGISPGQYRQGNFVQDG